MSLQPTRQEAQSRCRADLRIGLPVVLKSGDAAAIVAAAETIDAGRLAAMRALGEPVLAITARRAETLKARVYDGDIARIVLPDVADPGWITAVADPAEDLSAPMKGPLATTRDGDATLHRAAIGLVKSAHLLPAAVVLPIEAAPRIAATEGLSVLALDPSSGAPRPVEIAPVVSARVPLAVSETARFHVFRTDDSGEDHYAVEIGRPARPGPVLARLHSACFTGDLLGSLKCDCGPQLHAALDRIGTEGSGILLYLSQEGRGIGLVNKMRAYALQDQGFDTVEANHRLGFEDDERDFRIGAAILARMGFGAVRLLTNNPAKVAMMQGQGIEVVERLPLKVGLNPLNEKYLDTKAKKSGHIL